MLKAEWALAGSALSANVGRISEAPSDTVKYFANYYQHFMFRVARECQVHSSVTRFCPFPCQQH
ncbi:hypothetical protein CWC11_05785 [Pseudoalteromonas sp. S3178]|nr:hypothetical protein CWC11_05785 [Pseudoalteromonas sp. S3178]